MNNITKSDIVIGMLVDIVADKDRAEEIMSRGYIKEIITKEKTAKFVTVLLTNGLKGRVKHIVTKDEVRLENFKFYNNFFYLKEIYSIYDKKKREYVSIPYRNNLTKKIENTAFLFSEKSIALEILKLLNQSNYMITNINRRKPIVENFKEIDINFFSIDKKHKLSHDKLIEWEIKFKSI